MTEKVQKIGVERVTGYLYFIDKEGDVSRAKMAKGGKMGGKPEKVAICKLKKEPGYLYFLDKKGDISRAKMINPVPEAEPDPPAPKEQHFVALGLFGDRIRAVSLTTDGTYRFLDETSHLHSILYVASSETKALEDAVDELESLINSPKSRESDFQNFFERNPDFILNDDYRKAHPQVVLTQTATKEALIPDFVLEPVDQTSLCDLLELKLPTANVYVLKKGRPRFSAAVMEAAAQLRTYSRFFDEQGNRDAIKRSYGLLAYKPKMFVIIGRKGKVDPIIARDSQTDFPNLCLKTYDDLISRVNQRIRKMRRGGGGPRGSR